MITENDDIGLEKTKQQEKGKSKKVVLSLVLVFCLLLGIGLFFIKSRFVFDKLQFIDLNECVTLTCSGYNGYGEYETGYENIFDKDMFQEKLCAVGINDPIVFIMLYNAVGSINVTTPTNGKLSNGQIIKLDWTYMSSYEGEVARNNIKELYNIELGCEDFEYEVQNLKELEEFDVFENITMSFSGIQNSKDIVCHYKPDDQFQITVSNPTELTNGMKANVLAKPKGESWDEYIKRTGRKPIAKTKEVEISGLDTLITSIDELPVNALDELQDKACKEIYEHVNKVKKEGKWGEKESDYYKLTLHEPTLCNTFLLSSQEKGWNDLIFLYQVDNNLLYNGMSVDHPTEFSAPSYIGYSFLNLQPLIVDENGSLKLKENHDIIRGTLLYADDTVIRFSKGDKSDIYIASIRIQDGAYKTIEEFYEECIKEKIKDEIVCDTDLLSESEFADSDITQNFESYNGNYFIRSYLCAEDNSIEGLYVDYAELENKTLVIHGCVNVAELGTDGTKEKTESEFRLRINDDTQWIGFGGEQDTIRYSQEEMLEILNSKNGLGLEVVVKDGIVEVVTIIS